MNNIDALVKNLAPDADCLTITIGDWTVSVERDESGTVNVVLYDHDEGSETVYTLGEPGETQRC